MTIERHNYNGQNKKKTAQKKIRLISPLALVALAACNRDGDDISIGGSSSEPFSFSGMAMKGLLDNARVFVDLNRNGNFDDDEPSTFTNSDGSFTLSTSDRSAPVVVQSTSSTVDTSSGSVPTGLKMIGSTSGTVVSPATTVLAVGNLSKVELASALGLNEDIDVETYNPFAQDVEPSEALQFESISHQLQNTMVSIQTALEVNGLERGEALSVAVQSIVDTVVQSASENQALDFTDLSEVKSAVANRVNDLDLKAPEFETDLDSVIEAAKNVNKVISDKVQTVEDGDISQVTGEFAVSGLLAQQLNDAKSLETPSLDIGLKNSGVALEAAKNPAPTNINLVGDTVAENGVSNQSFGNVSANDQDANGNDVSSALKFYLLPSDDSSAFALSEDGELTTLDTFNFEEKADYELNIRAVDEFGRTTTETVSVTITDVNDAPTGSVEITGTAAEDQTLTANTSTLADEDGLGALTYQWLRDGSEVSGATGSSYTLTQDDVGSELSVKVSYTDGGGTAESVTSGPTDVVTNVNDAPTGSVAITGAAAEDEVLTAVTDTLADEDGLGDLSYQWKADDEDIVGATSDTLTLSQDEVGKEITVAVSYTDGSGTAETVTSAASAPVTNVNDDPVGAVTITGTASQGNDLTANTSSLEDEDGLGALSFQWLRDGADINGATASSYTLTQEDVGSQISLSVTYTDDQGTPESVISGTTATVTDVNDAPTGSVEITGTAAEDQTLTANTSTLADEDGLGAPTYQWLRDGSEVSGATEASYTLTQDDVGSQLSVKVSYTDDGGTAESVTSGPTDVVTNVNDDPTGLVSITGTAAEDETLTAVTDTLADEDGLGDLSYQWKADDEDIVGATSDTLTLSQDEVGKEITLAVSYTDGGGTEETVTSAASAPVTNVNDDPVGAVTITGTASQGNDLTANTSSLQDEDGLGALNYQWLRDGTDINGATASSYTLTQEDVGSQISLSVSYTDVQGTSESVSSAATATVTDVNDAPTGSVEITGMAAEGQTLTADTSTLADEDGLGALTYQWLRDGSEVSGATEASYTLTQDDVGSKLGVKVSYTDGGETAESVTSDLTEVVSNVNDDPTGSVAITGTAAEDEVLTADTDTLADEDGLGNLSYQWKAAGVDINGATTETLTLSQEEVGKEITVAVSYTDGGGTDETVTSDPTALIAELATSDTAFDIELASLSGASAAFEVYATEAADSGDPGLDDVQFVLSHSLLDMTIDKTSIDLADGFGLGIPNYDETTGELGVAAIAIPPVTDLSTPVLTFDATILNDDTPFNIAIGEILVDDTSQDRVEEVVDFSVVTPAVEPLDSGAGTIM